MAQKSSAVARLASNPKVIGAVWTAMLLLSQVGTAMAGTAGARAGP